MTARVELAQVVLEHADRVVGVELIGAAATLAVGWDSMARFDGCATGFVLDEATSPDAFEAADTLCDAGMREATSRCLESEADGSRLPLDVALARWLDDGCHRARVALRCGTLVVVLDERTHLRELERVLTLCTP